MSLRDIRQRAASMIAKWRARGNIEDEDTNLEVPIPEPRETGDLEPMEDEDTEVGNGQSQ